MRDTEDKDTVNKKTEKKEIETRVLLNKAIINKRAIRKNKGMKSAQKESKKRYGRVRMPSPKLRISKVVKLNNDEAISLVQDDTLTLPQIKALADVNTLNSALLIEHLEKVNLQGLSGGAFPVARKLQAFADAKAEKKYLLVNGVECEPGLLHDEWVLTHQLEDVKNGIRILKKCFDYDQIYLASKIENKFNIEEAEYIRVPNRYPMGEEKQLIKSVLGVELNKKDIPAQHGILVMNIQTVMEVGRIFTGSEKFGTRYLTIANLNDGTANIIEVTLGMKAKVIADKFFPGIPEIYIGAGVLSAHVMSENEVIDETTCFIGCPVGFEFAENRCRGCGACTANCPVGVDIRGIIHQIEKGQTKDFDKFHPERCIGCGACSFVCRADKNTMSVIAQINKNRH